jgi:tetratricopeptide (TPR) repeat protein
MPRINWMEKLGWNDDHLEELRHAGYSYIRQGKYETALPFFEALAVLNPDGPYDVQTLGALYVQLNEPSKAIRWLDRALQIESDHAPTLLNLAKALFMAGRTNEGLKLSTILKKDSNPFIASQAAALILAYG